MTPLNKQIIALRKKGLPFSKIAKQLKCSISTVSYALRKKTRIKSKQKQDKLPKHKKTITNKIYSFKNTPTPKQNKKLWYINKTPRQISKAISTKASTFQRSMTFNYKDVYRKYGDHFPCALTGRPLNFKDPDTYEYDHILPTSRGGENTLDNMQIVCPEVNRAKQNLTDQEFIDLCKEVVIHAGHKIYKPLDL
jgi:5-methylcytosine-specific restriction endonuclease McrA|tara:strand:+ start:595 stop:1176 length:582 start_codon:yes stop_codon:yes gene_type:complete